MLKLNMNAANKLRTIRKGRALAIALVSLWLTFSIRSGEPTEQVKATAEQILSVLRDPKWSSAELHNEQLDAIQGLISKRFDWEAISQGCMGLHWRARTNTEKKEFQSLLEDFLRRNYVEKITSSYTNLVEVRYVDERVIDNHASVRTKVITQTSDADVEYRLRKQSSPAGWKVYDALIEGVSLVKNYREQFDEIITKHSYEELVRRIRERIVEAADSKVPL